MRSPSLQTSIASLPSELRARISTMYVRLYMSSMAPVHRQLLHDEIFLQFVNNKHDWLNWGDYHFAERIPRLERIAP